MCLFNLDLALAALQWMLSPTVEVLAAKCHVWPKLWVVTFCQCSMKSPNKWHYTSSGKLLNSSSLARLAIVPDIIELFFSLFFCWDLCSTLWVILYIPGIFRKVVTRYLKVRTWLLLCSASQFSSEQSQSWVAVTGYWVFCQLLSLKLNVVFEYRYRANRECFRIYYVWECHCVANWPNEAMSFYTISLSPGR